MTEPPLAPAAALRRNRLPAERGRSRLQGAAFRRPRAPSKPPTRVSWPGGRRPGRLRDLPGWEVTSGIREALAGESRCTAGLEATRAAGAEGAAA